MAKWWKAFLAISVAEALQLKSENGDSSETDSLNRHVNDEEVTRYLQITSQMYEALKPLSNLSTPLLPKHISSNINIVSVDLDWMLKYSHRFERPVDSDVFEKGALFIAIQNTKFTKYKK